MDIDRILDAIASAGGGALTLPEKYIGQLNACYGTRWKLSDMEHPVKARALGRLYLSHHTLSYWLRVQPLLSV